MIEPSAMGPEHPELVQLLTPEGERVEHPDYAFDRGRRARSRASTATWCWSGASTAEATALQRQGELGLWASLLGQEAAQIGSGRALRPQDMAFPTYREHGVAWCRGVDPMRLLGLFRGVDQGGWDPPSTTSTSTRSSSATSACTPPATRWASSATGRVGTGDDTRDAPRSSTSATAPPARAT